MRMAEAPFPSTGRVKSSRAVLTGRPRRVSTDRALDDSVVTRVDKTTMVRMRRAEPKFSELFTAHILARTVRVEEDLIDQLFNSSEERLAQALLLLANFG
jgi:CRP/FNR family transcriptional regulator, cyclic AMP receptor protein